MGPDGVHPQMLKELANITARPLAIIFEGGPRELQATQLHLNPWKGDGAPHSGGHVYPHG